MNKEEAELLRQLDRGTLQDMDEQARTPEGAAALLVRHLELFRQQAEAVTLGMKPGCQRVMLAMEVFWESCFRRRQLRRRCMETLRDHPLAARVEEHGAPLWRLASELETCGIVVDEDPTPEFARRVRAVAREELAQDQRLPALRQIQYEWLERLFEPTQHRRLGKIDLR